MAGAPAGSAGGDWEIEIHGGGLGTFTPGGGRAASLPSTAGATFQTVVPGVLSRRVSSWYFGDGGTLIRQTVSASGSWGNYVYRYPTEVGHLDPLLSSATVEEPFGVLAGLRLGRRLGRRLTAEINVEYGADGPVFSKAARSGLETSRSAFESAWNGLLMPLPGAAVTSQVAVLDGTGHRLVATGVVNVNLQTGDAPKWSRRPPRHRFVSYLTFGAGIVSTGGQEASATLVGRYRFVSPSREPGAAFAETDTVTVRSYKTFGTAVVGVLGLGWKQDLSTHSGIRFDARTHLSRDPTRIVLDALPSVTEGSPASALVRQSSIGAIQFVNNSSGPYAGQQSSLSGPAIAGFETYRGTGIRTQFHITLGVFLRF